MANPTHQVEIDLTTIPMSVLLEALLHKKSIQGIMRAWQEAMPEEFASDEEIAKTKDWYKSARISEPTFRDVDNGETWVQVWVRVP